MDKATPTELPEREPAPAGVASKQIDLREQPKILRPIARLARALGVEILVIALVLLILGVVVWFATPIYLRDYLNKRGSELPDYKLEIHSVQINPLLCSIDLNQLVLKKKSNAIPVPFMVAERVAICLQWKQILHFDFSSKIILTQPVVNFVNGPTAETSQTFLEPAWVTAVKQLVPLKINRFEVHRGDLHYYDFHAQPEINLELSSLDIIADNLENGNKSTELMPSLVTITGHPLKVGELEVHLAVNTNLKQPTFSEKIRLEKVPAPALNSFIAKYASLYAKSGDLAFYSEMVSKDGDYNGYMKPFFQDLEFQPMPKDENGIAAIWASLANGIKGLLQNDEKIVATVVTVKGTYKDPHIDFWAATFGILKNAYIEALQQRFNGSPQLAPGGKPAGDPHLDKPAPRRP
jgi:hypothetical protein